MALLYLCINFLLMRDLATHLYYPSLWRSCFFLTKITKIKFSPEILVVYTVSLAPLSGQLTLNKSAALSVRPEPVSVARGYSG